LFYTQHTSQEEYLQPVTEDLIGTSHDWWLSISVCLVPSPGLTSLQHCSREAQLATCSAYGGWGDLPCLEGCPDGPDPGIENVMNLGVHHNDHIWVHPEPGHPVSLWRSGRFEAIRAMSGPTLSMMMISLHRMVSNEVIMVWSERMVTAWLKGLPETINSLTEPSFQISHRQGLYT
jgi:hypothetical protein